ncbi:fanconi-associated nuclease 1 [Microcaecilia unicolor]|uniref:Fanconi-associated nuclease n=1 Tax=Microcaecilia unicolor TaxID=1415580 RepID=A0A6P7X2M0_9AMPH|nr:fanconi-associated nuclease 1 [Microcaecilia unicolor]XP_030044385.1 fanconi-associated nuclease 1 [Microcaecilia unicolor]
MAEIKSPVKKRACRSLSLSKTKKKEIEKSKAAAAGAPSILTFFNNAQPAKLACPICGKMVPRFEINKHLDETCQNAERSDDDDVILVHSETGVPVMSNSAVEGPNTNFPVHSPQKTWRLQPNTSPIMSNSVRLKEGVKQRTSPYFKKNGKKSVTQEEPRVQRVRSVSLGSLSSKLSRSFQTQGRIKHSKKEENSLAKTVHCGTANSENQIGRSGELNDSQKENWCEELEYPARNSTLSIVAECTERHYLALDGKDQESRQAGSKMVKDLCLENTPLITLPAMRVLASASPSLEGKQTGMQDEATETKWETSHVMHASDWEAQLPEHSQETAEAQMNGSSSLCSKGKVLDHIKSCLENSNREILPMEGFNALENEIIYNDLLTPLQESGCDGNSTEIVKIQNEDVCSKSSVSDVSWQPYYLRNFLMVLQTVMENEDDLRLFNEDDMSTITKFHKLSDGSQKLYVRLFQRKLNWLKSSKIEYAEIGHDLQPVVEELVACGFLQSESELQELSEVLEVLSVSELKMLAKTFHLVNPNGQKQQLLEGFLQLAKQRSIFSLGKTQPGIGAVILKRAKELAGRCIRICRGPRAVFSRVLLLFSLTDSMDDEEAASGGQAQLSTVLMVNMGRMTFPTYTVLRTVNIFQDREDLIRYEGAMHKLIDIAAAMTSGNWEEAHQLYKSAKKVWLEEKSHPCLRYHEQLPVYLRCFTVGWTYTRILSRGVEILQRLHMYEEAVDELENLLSQNIYCPDSRGRWWDRLALNLHQHLKHTQKAITCIREGLSDPFVRTGHRLALCQRALRMRDSTSCRKFRHLFCDLSMTVVEDVTHVTIKGRMCPQSGMGKSVFLLEDVDDEMGEDATLSTVMCSVEELALAHYRKQGYDQGIHGEGSTFSTLYCLLMWDIIFMDGVPDVFRNSYQVFPLDLYTDNFFENRRTAIESRLQLLHDASSETLTELVAQVWGAQEGKAAALVSWERFTSLQHVQSLVSCFGGHFLSGVCQRLSKDLRHCRGGLPDLVVWSTQDSKFKLVEVKGPNDRLSHKQMIWLAELQKLGAEVEVCHVVAVGSKSNRLS